ncbi:MAG: phosphatidylserine decarboxylase, partial [Porticoccaceae bacterium]|nr:phosphatidylserine decarboxylase [Porticoccaceae bacterium]
AYAKGEEIGQFRFGSTVIVLFGENKVSGLEHLSPKAPVIMGEKLALLN